MVNLLSIGSAVFLALSVAMTVLAFATFLRSRRPRFAVLTVAFALIGAGAVWTTVGLFTGVDPQRLLTAQSLFISAGLLTSYFAVVKR